MDLLEILKVAEWWVVYNIVHLVDSLEEHSMLPTHLASAFMCKVIPLPRADLEPDLSDKPPVSASASRAATKWDAIGNSFPEGSRASTRGRPG